MRRIARTRAALDTVLFFNLRCEDMRFLNGRLDERGI